MSMPAAMCSGSPDSITDENPTAACPSRVQAAVADDQRVVTVLAMPAT